jgi:hypothetical protein
MKIKYLKPRFMGVIFLNVNARILSRLGEKTNQITPAARNALIQKLDMAGLKDYYWSIPQGVWSR